MEPNVRSMSVSDPSDVVFEELVSRKRKLMKRLRRNTVDDPFEVDAIPIPDVPEGGVRIRVCFAGACYTSDQLYGHSLRLAGIRDTSLFPGYEISGIVDEVHESIRDCCDFHRGDRVIVFPCAEIMSKSEYSEYVTVSDPNYLVHLPTSIPLELGAMLPSGALTAYNAVMQAKSLSATMMVSKDYKPVHAGSIQVLIVGAGGLGLLTLKMAKYFMESSADLVNVYSADPQLDKLDDADEIGCNGVIHWDDMIFEENLIDRTKDVCREGVDIAIDFVSTMRTIRRCMTVINESGHILVGGHCKSKVDKMKKMKELKNIVGIRQGSVEQLQDVVHIFAKGCITPPPYSVHPVEEATDVFTKLGHSTLHGRAVLKVAVDEALHDRSPTPNKNNQNLGLFVTPITEVSRENSREPSPVSPEPQVKIGGH